MAAAKETKGGNNPKPGKMKFGGEKKMPKPAAGNMADSLGDRVKGNKSKTASGGGFGIL